MKRTNLFAVATITLAAAVADDATFTVAYPEGTSQLSFSSGLAGTEHYAVLNDNDRYANEDSGIGVAFGASEITVTNRSGETWAVGTVVTLHLDRVTGEGRIPVTMPLPALADIANGDVLTEIQPGIKGALEHLEFVVTDAVTTAAKAATLNFEIDTSDVTGGVLVLTSAAATPIGKAISATLVTGANVLTPESLLSVEATSVTAFAEGAGYLVAYIRPDLENAY